MRFSCAAPTPRVPSAHSARSASVVRFHTADIAIPSRVQDVHRLAESGQSIAAVGLWNTALRLLALPSLAPILEEQLTAEAIPRSVVVVALEGSTYLLSGLGDGQLFSCVYHPASGHLTEKRTLSLGTQPVSLRAFRSVGGTHVFAGSDRPTVVYSANRKLMYSNVNVREVTQMCSFNCASFPDSLAISSKTTLTIGTIDNIQKLHIRTIPLGEQPRRIAHQDESKTFAVATVRFEAPADGQSEEVERGYVRLLDDSTYEVLHSVPLDSFECPCSIRSLQMGEDVRHYYAVGTAYHLPDEQEPTRGRILARGFPPPPETISRISRGLAPLPLPPSPGSCSAFAASRLLHLSVRGCTSCPSVQPA